MYIATITPSILKHGLEWGGLMNFVNFRGPDDNPFDSTRNFKKNFLHKILNFLSLLQISSLSNKHPLLVYAGHVTMCLNQVCYRMYCLHFKVVVL